MEDSHARAAFLAERKEGLGGTDAAAILGVSKWATAYDVWLDKTGRKPERKDSSAMWWGRELEELIAKRFMEERGAQVVKPSNTFRDRVSPFLLANPDRLHVNRPRGLEIKTASHYVAHEWGPSGSDEIPNAYLVQCQHYMMVTGLYVWDVAALIGGSDLRYYEIQADTEFIEHLRTRLSDWWELHIVRGEEPEIDGGQGATEYVKRRFGLHGTERIRATTADLGRVEELKRTRSALAELEVRETALMNQLKLRIGEAEGMDGSGWKISWRAAKGRLKTDWEAVARALAAQSIGLEALPGYAEAYTTAGEPVRRFILTER